MLRPAVLVTGAGGFIGSRLVNALRNVGHEVIALDCNERSLDRISREMRGDRIQLECVDITNPTDIADVIKQTRPAALVHLAAQHLIPRCEAEPQRAVNVNITGLCNTLTAAEDTRLEFVLFASSADVYARSQRPLAEGDVTAPSSVYGASKLLGERLVAEWAQRQPGRYATSVRIFNVYGPGDRNPHVIPDLIDGLHRGGTISVGNLGAQRDFIHVDDVVTVLCRLLDMPQPPPIVNAGSGTSTSIADLLHKLEERIGRTIAWQHDPTRLRTIDRTHLHADTTKLHATIHGFEPRSLDAGLASMLTTTGITTAAEPWHPAAHQRK